MRLAERIEMAGLAPDALAAFRLGLSEVVGAGGYSSMEHLGLSGVFDRLLPEHVEPAEFRDLWPHAELFLTAALTIAVSDGNYGVEEARVIGALASRLGMSASELAAIEDRVFEELRARGKALRG